jgi:hypothetical protein
VRIRAGIFSSEKRWCRRTYEAVATSRPASALILLVVPAIERYLSEKRGSVAPAFTGLFSGDDARYVHRADQRRNIYLQSILNDRSASFTFNSVFL